MRLRYAVMAATTGVAVWWAWAQLHDNRSDAPRSHAPAPHTRETRKDQVAASGRATPIGSRRTITLITTDAHDYVAPLHDTDADESNRALVESLGLKGVRYDRHLSRAATEFAAQHAALGTPPPSEAIEFLLHSAVTPDYNASQYYVGTSAANGQALADAVKAALADPPSGSGPIMVGVGEADAPGTNYARRLCVLVARRPYEVYRTPRTVATNATWHVRGELPRGYSHAHANVLYPDGSLQPQHLELDGREFTLNIPAGKVPGLMLVGIDGNGSEGPGKLLQLSVEVGQPPRRSIEVAVAAPEPAFNTLAEAETYAFELLNADRERLGLPALKYDNELAAIARAHSKDMHDAGFFGHRSPTTGLAADRLIKADYRASAHAENLAENHTLAGAERSLMGSVGHRRNIVAKSFSHVGLGVVRRPGKRGGWIVTQLFARKVVDLDPAEARRALIKTINDARRTAGVAPLRVRADLSTVAADGARRAADGELEGIARSVLDKVRHLVDHEATAATLIIYDVAQFKVPATGLARRWTQLGIAINQSATDPHGRTGVVLVFAR